MRTLQNSSIFSHAARRVVTLLVLYSSKLYSSSSAFKRLQRPYISHIDIDATDEVVSSFTQDYAVD